MAINNSISKYDLQYLVTGFFLISVFILTDLIGVFDKEFYTLYQDLSAINLIGFLHQS